MKLRRRVMYPAPWAFAVPNCSSRFVLAIWLSWNPLEGSWNWDCLVATFLEGNVEGTLSSIPFCFPVESSLLFQTLPSHKGLHLSLRSKSFALVSSAKSYGPSALWWEFWTFVTCLCLKCRFSFTLDVLLVELKQPHWSVGALCSAHAAGSSLCLLFFPSCETKPCGCRGLVKSRVSVAALMFCLSLG